MLPCYRSSASNLDKKEPKKALLAIDKNYLHFIRRLNIDFQIAMSDF